MQRDDERSIDGELDSLADFVSSAKALRPEAWQCVERLKLACVLVELFPEWTAVAEAVRGLRVEHA